jgi:PHD/YefM family antitoxin component YafN of YafNO toxin-antitoxin module
MATKLKRSEPEIIVRKGKPAAVIVPLDEYREMLERLEDADDLKALNALRKKPLRFRKLDDFLTENRKGV